MAVLPFSRPGIISATMLGLGRALGETIAVALILSAAFEINWHITEPGGNTFAANIALKWNEAGPIRALRVDRERSDSVHHHSGGQHDRPRDHRQAQGILRSQLMSVMYKEDARSWRASVRSWRCAPCRGWGPCTRR